ncbi:MAG: PhnD/SsuA/transferrin family substrate-binding protein [Planctomycetes bacterium]|nr:PhnD/SsuA/transferrin family substrate-binding protein [Planctomycetota bacterium]
MAAAKPWIYIALLTIPLVLAGDADAQPKAIRIGMAKTFIAERPKSFVEIATDEFKDVLKKTTGLAGDLDSKSEPFALADKLDGKQFDFGIFHAHEFAWVQKKHPDLEPILIAPGKNRLERAYVIVHKTDSAKTLGDLVGKKLDLAEGTSEPCRLYLDKLCKDVAQKAPAAFFGSIAKSDSPKEALDETARGKVQATIVDAATLDFYREIKLPVFEKNLRILHESIAFPPTVIAWRKGTVDGATLKQFRDGLLKAHTIPDGRDMMKTWNIENFEIPTKDYDKALAEISKAFPAPGR